jgi:hypothetical protein
MKKPQLLKDFHEALGEFVFTFETMLHNMKETMLKTMMDAGLKDDKLFDIFMSELMANQIQVSYRGMIYQSRESQFDVDVTAYITDMMTKINVYINTRNELLHATYGIAGFSHPVDGADIISLTAKKNKVKEGKLVNKQEKKNQELINYILEQTQNCSAVVHKTAIIRHVFEREKPLSEIFRNDLSFERPSKIAEAKAAASKARATARAAEPPKTGVKSVIPPKKN